MTNIGFKPAANDVVQAFARDPEQLRIGPNATPALMLPGIAVEFDTTDNEVKECSAGGAAIGVLGYAEANPEFKPATQLTPYVIGDSVPVYNGPGRVHAYLTETVVKGEALILAANGQFSKRAAAIDGHCATTAQSRAGIGRTWINLTGV